MSVGPFVLLFSLFLHFFVFFFSCLVYQVLVISLFRSNAFKIFSYSALILPFQLCSEEGESIGDPVDLPIALKSEQLQLIAHAFINKAKARTFIFSLIFECDISLKPVSNC